MRRLVQNPSPAIALLRDNLKPAQPVDVKRVQQWLLDLEGDDFMTRQAAVAKLEKLGDAIDTPLQKALTAGLGLEARRRVQAIVAKFETLTPDRLARSRALETLEQIATPEAVRLLESLAKGEPAARLTREARESLERIRKR
jgi:hypothetical protein